MPNCRIKFPYSLNQPVRMKTTRAPARISGLAVDAHGVYVSVESRAGGSAPNLPGGYLPIRLIEPEPTH